MPEGPGPFLLSQVLQDELTALGLAVPDLADLSEPEKRRRLYSAFYQHDLSALCLSGGGIRSASFSLGVIQALVDRGLLCKFNFLSTVSGGGYIGSWLSAWLHHTGNADEVFGRLGSRRNSSDREAPPLAHLREYSNYLTPRIGVFSADTWAAVAIVLRNVLVNWLILMPALALLVIGVKLVALALTTPALSAPPVLPDSLAVVVAFACLFAGGVAFGYKLGRLYLPAHSENPGVHAGHPPVGSGTTSGTQRRFLWRSLLPAVLGGFFFVWLAAHRQTPAIGVLTLLPSALTPDPNSFWAIALFGGAVYLIALIVGSLYARHFVRPGPGHARRFGIGGRDFFAWIGGVLAFATLVWLGARYINSRGETITLLPELCVSAVNSCVADAQMHPVPIAVRKETLGVIVGMPWFLLATILAHSMYLLLNSTSRKGEVEREWLGRASGWHLIAALGWILVAAVVLLGPALYYNERLLGQNAGKWLTALTVASGMVTAILGKSGLTPATGAASDWKGFSANITLAVAGPLFAALVLILLSVVIDWPVIGLDQQCFPTNGSWGCRSWGWWIPIVASLGVLFVANYLANVNSFSLHALYRNRLIRAFLGGARSPHRHPDGFTDFDWDDDLRVASLWKRGTVPEGRDWRPFHVINMTLNLAETNRLAWQQRKAMPFSVTPFFCGNADLGYRPTYRYGGGPVAPAPSGAAAASGISLGTAMAISGAAVSSNMGYHSSMSLSFLLTFFNVRLGCWLGNPGGKWQASNAPYRQAGPRFAVLPLLRELFGLTTADSPYVYLSDGGHFEDLGLYEMVRRRCRWIVVCDGDKDAQRGFGDLGNAVRKIWIDLGVRISFDNSPLLAADKDAKPIEVPYFALGTIDYVSDEPIEGETPKGKILYIKPIVRGDEVAADVIAYKRAHSEFPQQPTTEQWFDESQFEAYRRLGELIIERIASPLSPVPSDLTDLFSGLAAIDAKTLGTRVP